MKAFEPFRLDLGNECLWRVGERIPLTPKAFSLLAYLVERAGTLVTQNELMGKLWPDTFVQPEVLKTHIRDLRSALGDDARAPRFIETQHRRGYRFIAPVSELSSNTEKPLPAHSPSLVGQESNLKALGAIFQDASAGKPQLVFLTGEVGIGKTSLVNSFERQIVFTESHARVVRGQCVEGFAVHEAYYPVLEAISNLLRLPGCELVVAALARYAPTWLAQFPNQIEKLKSESLYRDVAGATRERMLRELNEGMKVIARDSALVVILEDVHWADSYTIDWLSAMARGGGAAKLMVVATLRPVGLALTQSPLKAIKHRLLTHKLCREIAVEPLAESAVDQYLRGKTQDGQVPPGLAQMIYAHSEGNPFFMGAILEHLLAQGMLSLDGGIWTIKVNLGQSTQIVPETLRQMIETHVGFMLSEEERRVLEAASVCGVTYTAAFVDTAAEKCQEEVEEICERLSSYGHFIRTVGTSDFPNGISSSQFEFVHSLYREIFYRRIPPARRVRFHKQIALRMEALYTGQCEEVSARLAFHFEKGLDWLKASQYLLLVARIEARRFAYNGAANILNNALKLLAKHTDPAAEPLRFDLQYRLAEIYSLTDQFTEAIEQLEIAERSPVLAADTRARVEILMRLAFMYCRFSGERCIRAANQAMELSLTQDDPALRAKATMSAFFWRVLCGGWKAEHAENCLKAVDELERYPDAEDLAYAKMVTSQMRFLKSEYRSGLVNLEAGITVLANAGSVAYRGAQRAEIWLLLFAGEWGKALDRAHANINAARRDGNLIREHIWLVSLAWIHQQALDHAGTIELCRHSFPVLEGRDTEWVRRNCLASQWTSEVFMGKLEEARSHRMQAIASPTNQNAILDWYFRLPRFHAEIELALRSGDVSSAHQSAQEFLNTSLMAAEHTWQALAWDASARVSLAEDDLPLAIKCVENAIGAMEGFDVPLAHWRVHRTAMQVFPDHAGHHRALAAATALTLANSLADYPSLKEGFLAAPEIRNLLR